jgi:hypothetical protein
MEASLYKLCFFVPAEHAGQVKEAVFAAGAGRLGRYDRCCWETPGRGQFRPLPGSRPAIGAIHELEQVDEWKIEMICDAAALPRAIAALRDAHPYETPAFEYWPINPPLT